ncbi:MAG: DNA repair protein RecO [Planctomycetota bacterium]|jgi:DNA repair protein RecO (recombination protein O)
MPTLTDTAVCLRRWDFSETSQTVRLFTREHGALRGLAKGAKRERGAFSGGFDVLARGQIVAIVKPGRELATLTEWSLQETFRVLRHRLEANRAGLYMADLVHHMVTDHDPHPALFDALVAALRRLEQPDRAARTLLDLQWTLLEETGYRPEIDRDARTGEPLPDTPALTFSARAGGTVAGDDGPESWRVRRETIDLLRSVARGEEPREGPAEVVDRSTRLLAVYARAIIGREIPTMRWAFPDMAQVR